MGTAVPERDPLAAEGLARLHALPARPVERYGAGRGLLGGQPADPQAPDPPWQIWNEPHLQFQWSIPSGEDYAPGYGKLLRASYKAIKAEDGGARVVLGGISNESWKYLQHMYDKGRIKGAFDVAALHPYTSKPKGSSRSSSASGS